jgi:hypothetical protein
MTNFSQALASTAKQRPQVNPFAQALADSEREKSFPSNGIANPSNPFSEALSKTGGSFSDFGSPQMDMAEQQRLMEEQRKKEMLHKKLHDQVNPVDTTDIFNAREQRTKQEIEQIRKELRLLSQEINAFHKEIEITLMTETVSPGQEGTGYKSFFQQLRAFIILLRQKIGNARTWATQLNGKKAKKKSKSGPGLNIAGAGHEKTSTIQDMMHHERSSQYSGG